MATTFQNAGARASTSCPGLEPGSIGLDGARSSDASPKPPTRGAQWVPALRPGREGGVSRASRLADLAVSALIAEAELTPKPGLVDARGPGAHVDLELDTLFASAEALRPTFMALAAAGEGASPSQALRETLARIGRDGEAAMFQATRGVNTHRGAIWALGLLVATAAIEGDGPGAEAICATAGAIACFPDRFAPHVELNGARACRTFAVSGARGEAAEGFPHALKALAALRASRIRGAGETAARLDALLAVMATLDDTCLLHRGGVRALRVARLGARAVIAAGGGATPEGMAALIALDHRLLALNASPGGAADMLAAALLLDGLSTSRHPGRSGQAVQSRDRAQDRAPNPANDPGSALRAVRDEVMAREV